MMPNPGEKLFRLGIRTIVDLPLSITHRNSRCSLGRFQAGAANQHPSSLQSLSVGLPGCDRGGVIAAVKVFLRLVNE